MPFSLHSRSSHSPVPTLNRSVGCRHRRARSLQQARAAGSEHRPPESQSLIRRCNSLRRSGRTRTSSAAWSCATSGSGPPVTTRWAALLTSCSPDSRKPSHTLTAPVCGAMPCFGFFSRRRSAATSPTSSTSPSRTARTATPQGSARRAGRPHHRPQNDSPFPPVPHCAARTSRRL